MRITRLAIKNYRGVAELDASVGDGATIAKGRNTAGKTSLLRALRAALDARDIGADAIRHGADSAEILVDLDDVSVRRAITRRTSTLTVSQGSFEAKKPQTFLRELLGTAALDPLDLLLLKPKERRARILEALPCSVTREQLLQWVPALPPNLDLSAHGMEVVETVRSAYYDRRTAANAKANDSEGEASRARSALGDAKPGEGPSSGVAMEAYTDVVRESDRLALLGEEAKKQEARNTRTRAAIAEKRAHAANGRKNAPDALDEDAAVERADEARREVQRIARELEKAEEALKNRDADAARARRQNADRERILQTADEHDAQAAELETTLAAGVQPPAPADVLAAAEAVQRANIVLAQARGAEALGKQIAEVERLERLAEADTLAAKELDVAVRRLTDEAPRALATTDSIPGLTLDGEDVLLDGKRLDALSGREQMVLCVEIAKRANAKAKFLIVDGLERIDEDGIEDFVREATRDGWQLIAAKVARGEMVLEHIAADDRTERITQEEKRAS